MFPPISHAIIGILACLQQGVQPTEGITFHGNSVVQFATTEQGAAALTRVDAFVNNLSRFDLQSRMNTDQEVTREQWFEMLRKEVREFSDEEQALLTENVLRIKEKLKPFRIPFPEQILLVKTTGKEEAGAAYCRGNAIILPQNMLNPRGMERLLTHELFHILSSNDKALQARLYKIVHFEPSGTLKLPAEIHDRKLTNPDAPELNYTLPIKTEDGTFPATPIMLADPPQYDPSRNVSFFQYLTFKLLLFERKDGQLVVRRQEGKPLLLEATTNQAYFEHIGRNTRYIVHPEEVLADNFVLLVQQQREVPNPEILEAMATVLGKPADAQIDVDEKRTR